MLLRQFPTIKLNEYVLNLLTGLNKTYRSVLFGIEISR
ncbi:hypothetical protein HAPAU_32840 [Halalkalicoccus paucihalophilus]|uniref:Uncharacterized protein n=1 Tax=Halalkalicoccus paucihalophilus TaxID=1008153 RepID=A0A151A9E5_9EURY|nr:hypothetical protein HAPAU_32840 [Halalkalicoccus paucihalophilus]